MSSGLWVVDARCQDFGPAPAIGLARIFLKDKQRRLAVESELWKLDWSDATPRNCPLYSNGHSLHLVIQEPAPHFSAGIPPERRRQVSRLLLSLERGHWQEVRVYPETKWQPAGKVLQDWRETLAKLRSGMNDEDTPHELRLPW